MKLFNIENAGKAVKALAKVIFIVNIVLTLVIAIIEGDALPDSLEVIIPFSIIVIGVVISYICYVLVFAFGELVENSKGILELLKQNKD